MDTQYAVAHQSLKTNKQPNQIVSWIATIIIITVFQMVTAFSQTSPPQIIESKQKLTGHEGWVNAVTFSPDGQTLVSGSNDQTLILWELSTGAIKQKLKAYQGRIISVAFSPDGQIIAGNCESGVVVLWDLKTGKIKHKLRAPTVARNTPVANWAGAMVFSPDGQMIAGGCDDGTVVVWSVQTGKTQRLLTKHSEIVHAVAFSPDGQTLASGSNDNLIVLWDLQTWRVKRELKQDKTQVRLLAFSPDGKTLLSGNAIVTKERSDQTASSATGSVVLNSRGYNWREVGCEVRRWDVETGELRQTLTISEATVRLIAFSPNGEIVGTDLSDNMIMLWDAQTRKLKLTLKGAPRPVSSVAFSPDGKTIAGAGWDRIVRLWDVSGSR